LALWLLGYPEAALADTERALRDAREIGQAVTLMYALTHVAKTYFHCGDYAAASAQADELFALADEKGALFWKYAGMVNKGYVLAMTGETSDAIQMFTSGIAGDRSTGSRIWVPLYSSYLARAHAELGQYEQARHGVSEAMAAVETTKERWCEGEINRIAGEIALMLPEADAKQAEAYFERALAIARAQQAKSWELRAAMSMARLWRDQGKRQQAHDLLVPVYGWFTEGFDTLDLKEAKALLEQLRA
jgi:predicted ATPase